MGQTAVLDGHLSLVTPEGIRLEITPAGPAIRGYAWLIDFVTFVIATFVFGIVNSLVFQGSRLGGGVFMLVLFVLYWAYPVLFEVYWSGQTPGKRAMGVRVVRIDGLPVGWRESTLRNLLLVADFMPFMYGTGLLCMLFHPHFRRLGDIIAGTQVIYVDKKALHRQHIEGVAEALPYPITADQQRGLIDLFEREAQLPRDRMVELASLAEPLTGQTGEASLLRLRKFAAGLTQ